MYEAVLQALVSFAALGMASFCLTTFDALCRMACWCMLYILVLVMVMVIYESYF